MIQLKHIYKSYYIGEHVVRALKDINLHIRKNEFISILGPSGSGKSTLMNIIGCLDNVDLGEYILEDKDISHYHENELSDLRLKKIGFIFQQFNLLPDLTAFENVEMPLLYHKMSRSEREKKVNEALEKVGLLDRKHHKPLQLSGGQQQRVAIARVLAVNPDIILADEPTGNLDSVSGKEIMKIINDLWEDGHTIILITHDLTIANQAKRKVYVYDGVLKEEE